MSPGFNAAKKERDSLFIVHCDFWFWSKDPWQEGNILRQFIILKPIKNETFRSIFFNLTITVHGRLSQLRWLLHSSLVEKEIPGYSSLVRSLPLVSRRPPLCVSVCDPLGVLETHDDREWDRLALARSGGNRWDGNAGDDGLRLVLMGRGRHVLSVPRQGTDGELDRWREMILKRKMVIH